MIRTQPVGEPLTETANKSDSVWVADRAWVGGELLGVSVVFAASGGIITSVTTGPAPAEAVPLRGVVLPGLVNAHSHAFHRLLRGRTHTLEGDFWLWRERMYEVAATLTPERYERLATAVFVEMALAGITTVGEFHYLHHQEGGVRYDDPNEMGHALIRAARRAGVRMALLDVGYFTAGFGDQTLHPVQTRFRDDSVESWLDRFDDLRTAHPDADDVVIGLAPHSVRAVPVDGLAELARLRPDATPLHIHVSEQPSENEECLRATSLTPVGLLDRVGLLDVKTTLVHATHLTNSDIKAVGSSGTSVCYCATTERDLADGLGPAHELSAAGASICVGSDSHAVIDLFEEARAIEMHARLLTGRRGVFAPNQLLSAATANGASTLGFPSGGLQVGAPADFIVVSPDSPRLAGIADDTAMDAVVFAATSSDVTDTFVSGRRIVEDGAHPLWESARRALD